MAIFIKTLFASIFMLFAMISMAHTIYAPNDIPLLDNRFRIDPKTEQATFIFNHSKGYQRVVLVQPDGSKLYQQRHPETVAWVSSEKQDIVTVQKPMVGPWQAIAELDGDNRIKIISDVELTVNRLPLKLYAQEYITTHASLYSDKKIMENPAYLDDAKLSISLIGGANKKMALYQDDGKHYDELPFDGKLTARLYVDLLPGRYLLNIRTKNDIFIRNVNKDAVVFLPPIDYKINPLETGSDEAKIIFTVDASEIDPNSVSIDGVLKDGDDNIVEQVLMHSINNVSESGQFDSIYKLSHNLYYFSGKAYATTLNGRELELQLPDRAFELVPLFIMPEKELSEALSTQAERPIIEASIEEELESTSIFNKLWVIIAIVATLLILVTGAVFFILKRKKKQLNSSEINTDELNLDELQPMPIDLTESKQATPAHKVDV